MAMEAKPPLKFSSLGGGGPRKGVEELNKGVVVKKEEGEGEEPTWMRLGLGAGGGGSHLFEHGKATPVITESQLFELHRQIVILSYISAGLPVPPGHFHSTGENFRLPNFASFDSQDFHYCNMMKLEPGRCRRTDGKKWRSNPYETPPQPINNVTNNLGNSSNNGYNLISTSSFQGGDNKILKAFGISGANVDITVTCNAAASGTSNDGNLTSLDLTDRKITTEIVGVKVTRKAMTATTGNVTGHKNTATIGNIKAAPLATTDSSSNATGNKNTTTTVKVAAATNAVSATKTTTVTNYKSGRIGRSHHIGDGSSICYNSFGLNNMTEKASGTSDTNKLSANNSQGLDISPKSILQVQGCHPSCSYRSEPEREPGRCRRTDGRKWRCCRDVIPDQKYCAMHIHRGAKRRVETSQPPVAFPTAKPSTSTHPHPNFCFPNKDPHATLINTKLSISIPANCQLVEDDDLSATSGSSDTTTS